MEDRENSSKLLTYLNLMQHSQRSPAREFDTEEQPMTIHGFFPSRFPPDSSLASHPGVICGRSHVLFEQI